MTLFETYTKNLLPHGVKEMSREVLFRNECNVAQIDFLLRECIGKTDDIKIPLCSHNTIINRELPENFCRVCHKELKTGIARWNDYLVLRHPNCNKPICNDCAEKNPDIFHLAFKKGLKQYKVLREDLL